ncbi:hypothetical protein D5R95_05005 [Methanosalsum natronophilum]|uniref:DUF420 domain-containing protein n=1 Tax=Methanosalsum natronophilum TaxID=768733 RepID=A0A3R7YIF3_9EURY|nr:uncharacterized membrane protein YozB (DUF420 family) [Methanosalsum natronophilum]RQD85280.1 MAG: hypothetical protein D5R95_05005 [Methanosalsum natronophilum]
MLGLNFPEMSLFLQIIGLIILLYSIFKIHSIKLKKDELTNHTRLSALAFILVSITVVYMIQSAYFLFEAWRFGVILPTYTLLLPIHALLGLITIVYAILFFLNKWKWKSRKYMRLNASLWILTFFSGFTFYWFMYM